MSEGFIIRQRRAFSLVELSLVLVVVGLLIGGVLTGRTMIRASELRSIPAQQNAMLIAIRTFKEKYNYLPGDMPNATSYWGLAGGANGLSVGCRTTASTDQKTCDGDGNGQIRAPLATDPGPEQIRIFQHLVNAGLFEGKFTGAYDAGGSSSLNSPNGKVPNTGWAIFSFNDQSGSAAFFDGVYGNTMYIGLYDPANPPDIGFLKPEEMWNIDTKVDDGKPGTGKLVVYSAGGLNVCTNTASSATLTADYLLTSTALGCLTFWRGQF